MVKKAPVQLQAHTFVCKGAGMIAGLEIWVTAGTTTGGAKKQFILVDKSGDGRFATDVQQWNSAASLNTPSPRKRKDAAKQNPATPSSPHPDT